VPFTLRNIKEMNDRSDFVAAGTGRAD